MSRARNIKPGFFKNDLLAECHPLARILFAGLWCEADREGRMEDRPKRLKAECLPYDECDINDLLGQLAERGFIDRYVVEGQAYIQIPQFSEHQNPHVRESASSIPAKPDSRHNLGSAKVVPEQVQAPDEASQGDDEHGTGPADSSSLIPLSPSQSPPAPGCASAHEPTPEDGQLPSGVKPEAWANFRLQLADDRKLSISRVKTALLQLHRIVEAGKDPNKVLEAAVMRGMRDLDEIAQGMPALSKSGQPRGSPPASQSDKPAINASFQETHYVGTPPEHLPAEYREAGAVVG